jgi:hypothetical protein
MKRKSLILAALIALGIGAAFVATAVSIGPNSAIAGKN